MNTTEQEPRCLVATCPSCGLIHSTLNTRDAELIIEWRTRWESAGITVAECDYLALPIPEKYCGPGGCPCPRQTVICPDPIIAANIREMAERSRFALSKYEGKDLTRTDLSPRDWLRHKRHEQMDEINYTRVLEGIYDDLERIIKELAEDNSRKADRIAELETQRAETMADYKRQAERIAELEKLESENARLKQDCADFSVELGLPPTMRPVKGWLARLVENHDRLAADEKKRPKAGDGWRDASKEKPQTHRLVMLIDDKQHIHIGVYLGWYWVSTGKQTWTLEQITHWRELPEPPNGGEKV